MIARGRAKSAAQPPEPVEEAGSDGPAEFRMRVTARESEYVVRHAGQSIALR